MADQHDDLIALTVDIVAAYAAHNAVPASDLPRAIGAVHEALVRAAAPPPAPDPEPPRRPISVKASIKPGYLVSMIDGQHYKMLRRHIGRQGYTPQSYREAFDLPHDYPMVAPDYAARRRELALEIGLGRKPGEKAPRRVPGPGSRSRKR